MSVEAVVSVSRSSGVSVAVVCVSRSSGVSVEAVV